MPQLTPAQIKRLGSFELSRDGEPVTGARTMDTAACWNFALTGTELAMTDPLSPESIYSSIFDIGINPLSELPDSNVDPIMLNGLRASATAVNHPGCGVHLAALHTHFNNALAGNVVAQAACRTAMLSILAIKNGLVPGAVSDQYQLHMVSSIWYTWDHFALSIRPFQPGRPRIFIQTVTGPVFPGTPLTPLVPLMHACNTIWDEHMEGAVVNLQGLHQTQVNFINMVNTYGDLCIECGDKHGWFKSSALHAWHRCTTCQAVYCPRHGRALLGKLAWNDPTRRCGQAGCLGRTQLIREV
ncbi:hypothetical protein [Metapseudomonas otitidis]|uniref:hypothetical protein n=1 Tax=Metapseudomonas otitidis TaxID=319939 RepID=UPI0013F62AD6|nr:hypothetical protein [Pseudomonas otitidis]